VSDVVTDAAGAGPGEPQSWVSTRPAYVDGQFVPAGEPFTTAATPGRDWQPAGADADGGDGPPAPASPKPKHGSRATRPAAGPDTRP
jgi:hypothetical protein